MTLKTSTLAMLALGTLATVALCAESLHPVADFRYGYLLGGGSAKGKWQQSDSVAKNVKGGTRYRVYAMNRYLGVVTGAKPVSMDQPCPDTQYVKFTPPVENPKFKTGVVALAGSWNAIPRLARMENTSQPVYRSAVAAILKARGIVNPTVKIDQLYRVDLEGDGVDEVLIGATNHSGVGKGINVSPSPDTNAGEYSVLLLRKVVGGKVTTTFIDGEVHKTAKKFNAPSVYRFLGFFDLNGDGKMELLTQSRYYEGDATTVYAVSGGRVVRVPAVLGAGCGA